MSSSNSRPGVLFFSAQAPELGNLVHAAYRSFKVMEAWNHASCDGHKGVQKLIEDIRTQGRAFNDALDTSVKVLEYGMQFASDCIELGEYMADPAVTHDDLREFVNGMRSIANRAQRHAKSTVDRFRAVRVGLLHVCKNLHSEVHRTKGHIAMENDQQRNLQTRYNVLVISQILLLPVLLPLMLDHFMDRSNALKADIHRREKVKQDLQGVLSMLKDASSDMAELIAHVDVFTNWWLQVQLMLNEVEKDVESIRSRAIRRGLTEATKVKWETVKNRYMEYKLIIRCLQDHFQMSLPHR